MTDASFDVKIWAIQARRRKTKTTYYVVWSVAGQRFNEGFAKRTLADSHRSALNAAANKGEPFDVATGLPASMRRTADRSWYDFACAYVDHCDDSGAATTRVKRAKELAAITEAMLPERRDRPYGKTLRMALTNYAFNPRQRNKGMPVELKGALAWAEKHSLPVSALTKDDVRARVVKRISTQLGGKPYAPSKANSHRITLTAAVNWAVATGVLAANPLKDVRREALPRITVAPIDMRRVANPWQVRTLLDAVRAQKPSGRILYAYYACHYFAVMRPEEVAALTRANLALPAVGWGKVYLDTARPIAGKDWTDSGEERDERQLKGRRRGEGRTAPCPPELTAILHEHLGEFGVDEHGRLFRGALGGQLHHSTVQAVWDRARAEAFTPEVYATPLAETPYDLRHAGVSAWLNEGVSPTRVASWAGHSLEILYKVYAASLDGSEARDRALVERALGHGKGR